MPAKRLTAKKVRICDIVSGRYFSGSREDLKPSVIITQFGQRISRASLVATVTDKFLSEDQTYGSITIDDETEAIRVKAFKEGVELIKGIEPGDIVLVVGKLKEYNGEVYINGEIVRKINDPNVESLRKLEILNQLVGQKKILEEIKGLEGKMPKDELKSYVKDKFGIEEQDLEVMLEAKIEEEVDYKPKILQLIESLDEGEGVDIGKIFELSDLAENIIEKAINDLLASGELYEPKPNVFKKV